MWNLKRPDISAVRSHLDTVFPLQAAPALLTTAHKDTLEQLYKDYEQANGRPLATLKSASLGDAVSAHVLAAYREVTDGGKLSALRSALKLSVDACPYCGFGEIRDLDHHLQKAHFQCFSIFPLNLVPACAKCNGHKPRKPRTDPNKHHIHAYLEDVSAYKFLVADVVLKREAMSVRFRVKKSRKMSRELFARLSQHLEDFHLNDRYPARVNIFLSEQKPGLEFAYDTGGADAVRAFLERSANASESSFGKNDWRTALFNALARSRRFCKGGFYQALGYKRKH